MAARERPVVKVAGVVLAAGEGRRFAANGRSNENDRDAPLKQLAPFAGEPLLRRICRQMSEAPLEPLVVVLGHRAEEVREALSGLSLDVVLNADWASGQSSSVRAGIDALPEDVEAALFVPGDQPFVDATLVVELIECFTASGSPIVVPRYGSRRGAPVLFARSQLEELRGVEGDEGGRQLIRSFPERVAEVELDDERALLDLDTACDLRRLEALARGTIHSP